MKREWIREFSEMPFTAEEYHVAEAVTWFTDSILYFNGKDYKIEDPSDTYHFTSKESLMENLNYTYNELEKQGVFDEEEDAPADPWLKVLEDRVAEEEEKYNTCKESIYEAIEDFKNWLNEAEAYEVIYDIEFKASELIELKNCYDAIHHRIYAARGELADYKEIRGC